MKLILTTVILASSIFMATCSNPMAANDEVHLLVGESGYRSGDAVPLVLQNASEDAVAYNLGFATLLRHQSGHWLRAPEQPPIATLAPLYNLLPGTSAEVTVQLAPGLPPGSYRFQQEIERAGRRDEIYSNTFEVSN